MDKLDKVYIGLTLLTSGLVLYFGSLISKSFVILMVLQSLAIKSYHKDT